MKPIAIYARVSTDRQKEQETIASQTAALLEHAASQNWTVPNEWRFLDEGYSGASLVRPGLDGLRDRLAEGQIDTVLVLSPDRLSRKYAYQILLAEEFHRHGAEVVFLKSPPAATPEERLLTQVQGMIAEYERAQIIERTRRGKRHRARQGSVNVLSGAPYGYRYVKKSDTGNAYFEVIETEAAVVRMVYEVYTLQHLSIHAITRSLNDQGIATRRGKSQWKHSVVWGILRNPAYMGRACFGKSECRPRRRMTRTGRQRGGYAKPSGVHQPRPRQDWIEIPVPALIDETVFAIAQERLETNKQFSQRRTITPTLLQSLLVCQRCGYSLCRTSSSSKQGRRFYYRLYRQGWLSAVETRDLRQPDDSPRLSGWRGLGRSDSLVGGPSPSASRDHATPGSGQTGRSDATASAASAPGASPARPEHRATADCLSRQPAVTG